MKAAAASGSGCVPAALLAACAVALSPPALLAPPPGEEGSDAVAADDPRFVGWASGVSEVVYGESVDTPFRAPERALGPATTDPLDTLTLGRGGSVTLTFGAALADGPGWDFAVFENAVTDAFLELAFVEVSSGGEHWVRFPSRSDTPARVPAFGRVETDDISGLAGRYRVGWGTPFDLADLAGVPGAEGLDPGRVTHVRIVDVIGDGRASDSRGEPIYDPYPTQASAGFDLEAVGFRYRAGAPPGRPLPVLHLGLAPRGDGGEGLSLGWAARADRVYRVLESLDLRTWTEVETVPGEDGETRFSAPVPAGADGYFLRVVEMEAVP